jgi:hypothetical protein
MEQADALVFIRLSRIFIYGHPRSSVVHRDPAPAVLKQAQI